MQTGSSELFKALGAQLSAAHAEAANAETTMPMMDLPGGIKGGIAQVVECKFDKYKEGDNKGKWYFYCAAVVIEPKTHEGRKVEGLRTSIMEPMCETPSRKRATIEAHMHYVYNEFRKLGVDTREISPDQLEDVAAHIKAAKPIIGFSTRLGKATPQYPDPKVFEQWEGLVQYGDHADDEVNDNTPDPEPTPAPPPPTPKATKPKAAPKATPAPTPPPPPPVAESKPEPTLDDLVAVASGVQGDEATEAQSALTEKAKSLGVSEESIQNADDWQAVADLIVTAEANADLLVWQAGDVCKHAPLLDKKTKKRGPEALFAITAVDEKAKTANLKGVDDAKVSYAKVPWSELREQ